MGHGAIRVAEVDDVDHVLAELGQFFGRVHRPGRQDQLEHLISVADPLLTDRLVGIVRDRQGIIEVDLAVALGQGRRGETSLDEARILADAEPAVELERVARVVVSPGESV